MERIELPGGCHFEYYKTVGDVDYYHLCRADGQHLIDTMFSGDEAKATATAMRGGEGVREALEWYGEQARLCRLIHTGGDAGRAALADDGGKRARAAVAQQGNGGSGDD